MIIYNNLSIYKEFSAALYPISLIFIAIWAISSRERIKSANKFMIYLDSQHSKLTND